MGDTVKPIGDRLAVEPIEEGAREEGGIFIPESVAQEEQGKPQQGYVRAVGTRIDNIEEGSRIMYAKQAAYIGSENKVEIGEKECILIEEKHVLAVIVE